MKKLCLGFAVFVLVLGGSMGSAADDSADVRYLIYLHGWIIQDQQIPRPRHPQFGHYELEKILDTFREQGFEVRGEIRPKSATVDESADKVVQQVQELLESGVPANRVTVVGASMGASIALLAAKRLGNAEVRFAVLGTCLSANISRLEKQTGGPPSGSVLAIREASDDLTSPCPELVGDVQSLPRLQAKEIVLDTGLRHGFLYRPIPEWVAPVVKWAKSGG